MTRLGTESTGERIERELTAWAGVTAEPHRFGGREYRIGATDDRESREFGHVHGGRWADLPLAVPLRDALVDGGHASPHHRLPDAGWVRF